MVGGAIVSMHLHTYIIATVSLKHDTNMPEDNCNTGTAKTIVSLEMNVCTYVYIIMLKFSIIKTAYRAVKKGTAKQSRIKSIVT